MRLIDADVLKMELEGSKYILPNDLNRLLNSEINRCIEAIDYAPTVELTEEQAIDKLHKTGWLPRHDKEMTERPQGEWEENNESKIRTCWYCTNCGYPTFEVVDTNFCPNCGARMKGGAE